MLIISGQRESVILPPQKIKSKGEAVEYKIQSEKEINPSLHPGVFFFEPFTNLFHFSPSYQPLSDHFCSTHNLPLCFWAHVIVVPCLPGRKASVPLIIDAKIWFVYCLSFIGAMGEYEPKIEVHFPDTVPAAKGSTVKLECFALGK